MSRGPVPDFPPGRPTVRQVVPLARAIYAKPEGGAGCCLHVLLDDANYDCAMFCLEWATERGHADCAEVARLLSEMSPSQVRRVVRETHARG